MFRILSINSKQIYMIFFLSKITLFKSLNDGMNDEKFYSNKFNLK